MLINVCALIIKLLCKTSESFFFNLSFQQYFIVSIISKRVLLYGNLPKGKMLLPTCTTSDFSYVQPENTILENAFIVCGLAIPLDFCTYKIWKIINLQGNRDIQSYYIAMCPCLEIHLLCM